MPACAARSIQRSLRKRRNADSPAPDAWMTLNASTAGRAGEPLLTREGPPYSGQPGLLGYPGHASVVWYSSVDFKISPAAGAPTPATSEHTAAIPTFPRARTPPCASALARKHPDTDSQHMWATCPLQQHSSSTQRHSAHLPAAPRQRPHRHIALKCPTTSHPSDIHPSIPLTTAATQSTHPCHQPPPPAAIHPHRWSVPCS